MNKPPASALLLIVAGLTTTASFWIREPSLLADPPPSPLVPDIIGIHVGMPMKDAVAALKAYNPGFKFAFTSPGSPVDSDGEGADCTATWSGATGKPGETFHMSGAPAPPHVVFHVSRAGGLVGNQRDYVLGQLRKKYGLEYGHDLGGQAPTFWWRFDRQGRSLTSVKECSGNGISTDPCQSVMFSFGGYDPYNGVWESLHDEVMSKARSDELARRAKEKAQKEHDEQVRRDEQNRPKL